MTSPIVILKVSIFYQVMEVYICDNCGSWNSVMDTQARECQSCLHNLPNAIGIHTDNETKLRWHFLN